jgi:hypothetical protein
VTVSESTEEAPLWVVGAGRPRPRPAPSCALCRKAQPATPFGLCFACLSAAADEHARLSPPADVPLSAVPAGAKRDDGKLCSVRVGDLCGRCGSWRHSRAECDA